MKSLIRSLIVIGIFSSLCGCWAAAVGVGAEGGYIASQESRTAGETLDDQRITASVKTSLLADSQVSGMDINVDTFKKNVTLKGVVGSASEAEKAVTLAKQVSGVRSVESKLYVE